MVDAGVVNVRIGDLGELGGVYADERVIDVVFAETRSGAQYAFWRRHLAHEGDLHEFNYRTRLLKRGAAEEDADIDALWAMVGLREPLLEKVMREKGWYTDPEFWAERIELELGEMIALYGGRGLTREILREAVWALAMRYADDPSGRWA